MRNTSRACEESAALRKRRGLPVRAFAAVLIASPTLKIPIRQIGREAFGKCAKNLRVVFSRVLARDCSIYVGGKNMSRGFICCAIFLRKFKGAALRALRTLSARFISASHAFRVRCLRAAPAFVSVSVSARRLARRFAGRAGRGIFPMSFGRGLAQKCVAIFFRAYSRMFLVRRADGRKLGL